MNKLNRLFIRLLLILSTILPWSGAMALEAFESTGFIREINIGSINVDGLKYVLTPTIQFKIPGVTEGEAKLSYLKPGDNVFVKGRVLDKRNLADLIVFIRTDNN